MPPIATAPPDRTARTFSAHAISAGDGAKPRRIRLDLPGMDREFAAETHVAGIGRVRCDHAFIVHLGGDTVEGRRKPGEARRHNELCARSQRRLARVRQSEIDTEVP